MENFQYQDWLPTILLTGIVLFFGITKIFQRIKPNPLEVLFIVGMIFIWIGPPFIGAGIAGINKVSMWFGVSIGFGCSSLAIGIISAITAGELSSRKNRGY